MPSLRTFGLLGLTGLLAPVFLIAAAVADPPSATASPQAQTAAIAFDQIDRVLTNGATPPPVGSFDADVAMIAALPSLDSGVKKLEDAQKAAQSTAAASPLVGMIPVVGGFIAGAASHAANAAAQAGLQHQIDENNAAVIRFVNAGSLSRYAFYHGFVRTEHVGRDVTIHSADRRSTTVLDIAHRTARTTEAQRASDTYVVSSEDSGVRPTVEDPSTQRLPEATIDGIPTRGYRTTATLLLPRALAWCAGGRHSVTQVEYVAERPDPELPTHIADAQALSDGCSPNGTTSYREPGRLVLYRATSVDPATPLAVSIVFERGNIRALDATSMSLFSIPSDFTKEQ